MLVKERASVLLTSFNLPKYTHIRTIYLVLLCILQWITSVLFYIHTYLSYILILNSAERIYYYVFIVFSNYCQVRTSKFQQRSVNRLTLFVCILLGYYTRAFIVVQSKIGNGSIELINLQLESLSRSTFQRLIFSMQLENLGDLCKYRLLVYKKIRYHKICKRDSSSL